MVKIYTKDTNTTFLSGHIEDCIKKHNSGYSKLNTQALSMDGIIKSGRNLLNLLADFDGCRYMHIGTWKGACLYSALCGNSVDYAIACDNFSMWTDPDSIDNQILDLDIMLDLMQPKEQDEIVEFEFYGGDCFSMPLDRVKKPINMYFYDGSHKVGDHFLSLYYYDPVLDNEFVFVCDDWQEEKVKVGTFAAIMQCSYKIISSHVCESLYVAHLKKNKPRNESSMTHPSLLCKLTNKNITKKDIL